MTDIKYMGMEEFRNAGYLQEANRRFFHPLGLAVEVQWNTEGGGYAIVGSELLSEIIEFFGEDSDYAEWVEKLKAASSRSDRAIISGVWDYREDEEGMRFDFENAEEFQEFVAKAERVKKLWHKRKKDRVAALGYMVQPYADIETEIGSNIVSLFADALAAEMNSVIPVKASSESWQKAARGILDKVTHKFSEEPYEPSAVTPEEVQVMDLIVGNPSGKHSRAEALNMIIDDRNSYREMLQTATAALAAIRDGKGSAEPNEIADIALSDIAGEMGG